MAEHAEALAGLGEGPRPRSADNDIPAGGLVRAGYFKGVYPKPHLQTGFALSPVGPSIASWLGALMPRSVTGEIKASSLRRIVRFLLTVAH